jgi:uncharacterized protein YdhG (YjbR/CyaY superfamily)
MQSPTSIDDYIAGFPHSVQQVLVRIRKTISEAAPSATETISYGMPTFKLKKTIVHFGAFKDHIGLYPPVREPQLQSRIQPYKGEKGNLRFPLDQAIPFDLIADIVKARAWEAQKNK